MCKDCGCETALKATSTAAQPRGYTHTHSDGTVHTHAHEQDHVHEHEHEHEHAHDDAHASAPADTQATRTLTLETRVLAHNDRLAAQNRAWLAERKIVALNFISSPGTGKTLLLEKTIERLRDRVGIAVIAGDQNTDNDKRRLAAKGVPVEQIETHSSCHLDAERVAAVLPGLVRADTKLLLIENVGNLVCPAAFDLGETFKVALLSTTEGEDKPIKYPVLFAAAQVVVLTKIDLAPHLDWDIAKCRQYIQRAHPGIFVFEVSAKTGEGLDTWCNYLERLVL